MEKRMHRSFTRYKDTIVKVVSFLVIVSAWQIWGHIFPQPSGVETSLNRGVWLMAVESHQPQQPLYRLDLTNRENQASPMNYAWMSRRPSVTTIESEDIAVVTIPAMEGNTLSELYTQWCQHTPTFRAIQPDETYYEVGVGCGAFHRVVKRYVPEHDLPLPLKTLFQRLLPPEARSP